MSRLARLGFASYDDYLRSGHWITFRLRWLNSPATTHRCLVCDHDEVELHHVNYERLGAEEFSDVVPLCKACHCLVHEWLDKHNRKVSDSHIPIGIMRERYLRILERDAIKDRRKSDKLKKGHVFCPLCNKHRKHNKPLCGSCLSLSPNKRPKPKVDTKPKAAPVFIPDKPPEPTPIKKFDVHAFLKRMSRP